jgi:SAM-dependent methyltransferase
MSDERSAARLVVRALGRLRALGGKLSGRQPDPVVSGASAFWDDAAGRRGSIYWAEHPLVRNSINRQATGLYWLFPTAALKAGWAVRPLGRGVSIGCGTGNLERNVLDLAVCRKIDAFDVSPESIRTARRLARGAGHRWSVRYRVADCNRLVLPRERYDIAFFHHSLHHIGDPDRLLSEVAASLRPGGLLFVDEYVGPSRDEWKESHLRFAREEWERLPAEFRLQPVAAPLPPDDPSEMIRSSRILPAIRERFDIVFENPYWGNLLFPLFCALDGAALLHPANATLVQRLVDRERDLAAAGAFDRPLFAVVLARRKG